MQVDQVTSVLTRPDTTPHPTRAPHSYTDLLQQPLTHERDAARHQLAATLPARLALPAQRHLAQPVALGLAHHGYIIITTLVGCHGGHERRYPERGDATTLVW
jgi:hypothetical protein